MEIPSTNSNNNQTWACNVCTLINSMNNIACEACGSSRQGNTENAVAFWTCQNCTTYNTIGNNICMTCGLSNTQVEEDIESDTPPLEPINSPNISQQVIFDVLRMIDMVQPAPTPRQEAENIAFDYNPCRCMRCKLGAIRRIIVLSRSASTERQIHLSGIMMNEILPELIMTTFAEDNPIVQILGSGSLNRLQEVLDRSFAEADGMQRPATEKDMECLQTVEPDKIDFEKHTNCTVCMDPLNKPDEGIDPEIVHLPCNHHFHKQCITEWLKHDASCPICKARIDQSTGLKVASDEMVEEESMSMDQQVE